MMVIHHFLFYWKPEDIVRPLSHNDILTSYLPFIIPAFFVCCNFHNDKAP